MAFLLRTARPVMRHDRNAMAASLKTWPKTGLRMLRLKRTASALRKDDFRLLLSR